MVESSKVWRRRLRRALLGELVAQELRAGKGLVAANALAERRLAAAAFKARHGDMPGPEDWPSDARERLSDPDEDEPEDQGADTGGSFSGCAEGA